MKLLALLTPSARGYRMTIRSGTGPWRLLFATLLVDHPAEIGRL